MNCSKECIINHTNDTNETQNNVTTSVISNNNHNHTHKTNNINNVNIVNTNNVNNVNDNVNDNVNNNNNVNNINFPSGNKTYFDNYAPFDSKLWPGYNQSGWDLDKLDKYNTDEFIEVLIPNQFPAKTPIPNVLF